jgi:hypothetical protein
LKALVKQTNEEVLVSTVLKTPIEITLDPLFPYDLVATDFSVNATDVSNDLYIRYLNVLSVRTEGSVEDGNEKKIIRCMFGGAYTGMFQMSIRHRNYGLLDTTNMLLDVSSKVTAVSPTSGSIHGGTLLTITGTNFGTEKTDNPV